MRARSGLSAAPRLLGAAVLLHAAGLARGGGATPSPWIVVTDNATQLGDGAASDRVSRVSVGQLLRLDEALLDWSAAHVALPLVLPSGEEVWFELSRSQVMAPALAAAFPDIVTLSGESVGAGPALEADVDYSPQKGLRAQVRSKSGGEAYYVDPLPRLDERYGERVYKSYDARDIVPGAPWSCRSRSVPVTVIDGAGGGGGGPEEELARSARLAGRRALATASRPTYHFRVALVANGQYSLYHGNSKSSVLAEMVTLLNRVNGIFKRELGVFLQLHEQTAALICLSPCSKLSNNGTVLDELDKFVYSAGVNFKTFDVGHALTTGSGGLACVPALCTYYKTCGTSGLADPTADAFYVDYVSHELGHQFGADHTYQDCEQDLPPDAGTAVEPGSGSTIMAYAGVCGSKDLQPHTDAYFHAVSVEQIWSHIDQVAGGTCGRVIAAPLTGAPPLALSAPRDLAVPIGNYFRLASQAQQAQEQPQPQLFYTVDVITPAGAAADYSSRAEARFRSWPPVERPARTFPNLYYIVHGLAEQVSDEVLPSAGALLRFRHTARTLFPASGAAAPGDNSSATGFGAQAWTETAVEFRDDIAPLRLAPPAADLQAGAPAALAWAVGGTAALAPRVQILIARANMPLLAAAARLDYATDVKEPDWILLAETDNDGQHTLPGLPYLPAGPGRYDVLLLLRSASIDGNYFFDLRSGITMLQGEPPQPSESPSQGPSKTSATQSPSVFQRVTTQPAAPTPASQKPSRAPSRAPAPASLLRLEAAAQRVKTPRALTLLLVLLFAATPLGLHC